MSPTHPRRLAPTLTAVVALALVVLLWSSVAVARVPAHRSGSPGSATAFRGFSAGGVGPGVGARDRGGSTRVRTVQRRLRAHGYDPGPIDGRFGDRTERAVRRFQVVSHLATDGVVGPRMLAALGAPRTRSPHVHRRAPATAARVRPATPRVVRPSPGLDAVRRGWHAPLWALAAVVLGLLAVGQATRRRLRQRCAWVGRAVAGGRFARAGSDAGGSIDGDAVVPIFFDTGHGRRWRRIRGGVLVFVLVVAAALAALGRSALQSPLTPPRADAHVSVRAPSLSALDVRQMPLFGQGVFQRIVRLEHLRGGLVAADLFTGRVVHWLSHGERRSVGHARYAFEHYGVLPRKQLALTFDDGPDRTWTPRILNLLARYRIQASFFLIGSEVAKDPQLARRVVQEGHLIGNHTFTHPAGWPLGLTRDRIELALTDRVIRAVTGRATQLFRNPYGGNDIKTVRQNLASIYTAQRLGYQTLAYDLDSHDWQFETQHRRPLPLDLRDGRGHVVLLHDGGGDRKLTYAYLERTITQARRLGYSFTTPRWISDRAATVYRPVRPSISDRATLFVAEGVFRWTHYTLLLLFMIGVASMFGVTTLYIILAAVQERRGRRHPLPAHVGPVSVAIAAFNEEDVIERTVRCVLRSVGVELELLVIDDGSTDRTPEILDRLKAEDPRLRVFHIPNGGKGHALNLAFGEAAHERVITFDADTVVPRDTVARLARHFDQPRVAAVAGLVKVANLKSVLTAWQSLEYIASIGVERTAQSLLGTITVVPGACAAWRRSLVLAVGGFTTDTLAEDCDLTLKLQRAGGTIIQDNTALAFTEAPQGLRPLLKQRFRWSFGNLQALWKHRSMMFRRRHGLLGMVVLPYTFISLALPIVFLPMLYTALITSAIAGGYLIIVFFAGLFTLGQGVICFFGLLITRSSLAHLLVVPLFRIISEPLRIYLLYKSLFAALKGRQHGWNKLPRTGAIATAAAEAALTV